MRMHRRRYEKGRSDQKHIQNITGLDARNHNEYYKFNSRGKIHFKIV